MILIYSDVAAEAVQPPFGRLTPTTEGRSDPRAAGERPPFCAYTDSCTTANESGGDAGSLNCGACLENIPDMLDCDNAPTALRPTA
jgi:hypothetical protein